MPVYSDFNPNNRRTFPPLNDPVERFPFKRAQQAAKQLRYPLENYDHNNGPVVVFRQVEATYENERVSRDPLQASQSGRIRSDSNFHVQRSIPVPTNDVCGLYIPPSFQISDNANWEQAETGIIGNLTDRALKGETLQSAGNLLNTVSNIGTNLQNPDVVGAALGAAPYVAGAIAAGGSNLISKVAGEKFRGVKALTNVLSGVAVGTATGIATRELRRSLQVTANPREFMLFKGPSVRSFSLDFRFMPTSEAESDAVVQIIQWFREAMYPELSPGRFTYIFPPAFLIEFINVGDQGYPKIPQVVITSANTTYNPNTLSYFYQNGRPVEVNLSLSFSELEPIHKEMVRQGF